MSDKQVSQDFIDLKISIKKEVSDVKIKDKTRIRMEKASIPEVKKVEKETLLDFPDDITEIPSKDLGKYLGIYEAFCGWIGYCIARREIDEIHSKELLKFVYNKLLSTYKSDKITDKRILVEADAFYLESKMEVNEVIADLKVLEATLVNYQGYAKAISREISNRLSMEGAFSYNRTGSAPGIFGGNG